MANVSFRIFRLKDRELLEAFDRVRQDFQAADSATVSVNLGPGIQAITTSLPATSRDAKLEQILAMDSAIASSVSMSLQSSATIAVNRQPDTGIDQLSVNYPDRDFDPGRFATLMASCHRHLPAFDRADSLSRLLGPELSEFYARREQTLQRLESLTERLIEQNSQYRRDVDQETTALRQRLQAENEAERSKNRAEADAKEAELKEQEKALGERIRALDDRRATHARRQIRADMKQRIRDREADFSLTPKTVRKRFPIHILFGVLVTVPALVLTWGLWDVWWHGARWDGTPVDWVRLLRIPLGAAGVAGFVVYYIRWLDQWFRQHAEEEFRLKRFDLDIDRASWVVEMMLEWKDEKQSPPPPELIDRISRNLFMADNRGDTVARHPVQDLASLLLQASSSITLPIPGGGSATLDAKGLRRFQKQTEGGD